MNTCPRCGGAWALPKCPNQPIVCVDCGEAKLHDYEFVERLADVLYIEVNKLFYDTDLVKKMVNEELNFHVVMADIIPKVQEYWEKNVKYIANLEED